MAHITTVELAIQHNFWHTWLPSTDPATLNSPLAFVASLPPRSRSLGSITVRDTLALLILRDMSSPSNQDQFNFIFGRIDFVIGFNGVDDVADETLFRSRLLLAFFKVCNDLHLTTFASKSQIVTMNIGYGRRPRGTWSSTLLGYDTEAWMAWLLQEGESDICPQQSRGIVL